MKTFMLKNCHHPPECRLVWRGDAPIIIEKERVKVAAVPLNGSSPSRKKGKINGEALKDCILTHPRYVKRGIKHEMLRVNGLRNGRTIDVLLDEPFSFGGKEHWVMNFKGVGANAVEPMIIHPTGWFVWNESKLRGHWTSREDGDPFGRVWGAVQKDEAAREINEDVMQPLGIPIVSHVQGNTMPMEIVAQICKLAMKEDARLQLSQVVRACRTNMRMEMAGILDDASAAKIDFARFGEIDARIVDTQLWHAQNNERLYASGDILSNRYVDGIFTDSENYAVREFNFWKCQMFISTVLRSTISILPKKLVAPYLKILANRTGIPFDKRHSSIFELSPELTRWTPDPGVPNIVSKSERIAKKVGRSIDMHFFDALTECTKYR